MPTYTYKEVLILTFIIVKGTTNLEARLSSQIVTIFCLIQLKVGSKEFTD